MPCMIPANPDISGPGVRVAIYMQNFLSFIPAFWALTDGVVSREELETVEKQSMSILITAFSILISTIVQACTFGLSDFHTSIILSLSWMNNTNTFIYFLLYISYKSHPNRKHEMVKRQWKAWLVHVWEVIWRRPHAPSADEQNHLNADDNASDTHDPQSIHRQGRIGRMQHTLRLFRKRIVFTLGSLHLTLMAAIGIWLWLSPSKYEQEQENRTDGAAFDGSDGLPLACTYISLVGSNIPLTSAALRSASLVMYSLFLIPGLNLFVPALFFLLMFIGVRWRRSQSTRTNYTYRWILPLHRHSRDLLVNGIPQVLSSGKNKINSTDHKPNVRPIWIGLIILLIINIVFLADIEVMISRAKHSHDQQDGESEWTFGQTLALLLLVLPIRDVIDYGAIQEQLRARRATRKMIEAVGKGEGKVAFKAAKAADNLFVHINDQFLSIFMFAAAVGHLALAEFALSEKVKDATDAKQELRLFTGQVNTDGTSALIWAARGGHEPMVRLLLEHGADVNQAENDGWTPLIWAARKGHEPMVRLLLEHGADVNQADKDGQTPLIYAAHWGQTSVMQILVDSGAEVEHASNNGQTPLHHAAGGNELEAVRLLLELGADVGRVGNDGNTAVDLAKMVGNWEIVRLLEGAMERRQLSGETARSPPPARADVDEDNEHEVIPVGSSLSVPSSSRGE